MHLLQLTTFLALTLGAHANPLSKKQVHGVAGIYYVHRITPCPGCPGGGVNQEYTGVKDPSTFNGGNEACNIAVDQTGFSGNFCDRVYHIDGQDYYMGKPDAAWEWGCHTFDRLNEDTEEIPAGSPYANLFLGDTIVGQCVTNYQDGCVDSDFTSTGYTQKVECRYA